MIDYTKFDIEDFAGDDKFINWCLMPDETTNMFWQNWIKTYPEKENLIKEAKDLVLDLNILETEAHEGDFEKEIWSEIEENTKEIPTNKSQKLNYKVLVWASAAVIFLCIGSLFYFENNTSFNHTTQSVEWINFENNSGLCKTIVLADSSTVIMEPFSNLKYPSVFSSDQRIVFLKGEAFFDITRDTLKPFLVYANETITKVLGTSFRVIAFEGEKNVEVEVTSGKVAVYANVASGKQKTIKEPMKIRTDEIVLIPRPNKKLEVTPNQKVVFNHQAENMIKRVAELPQLITKIENLSQFQFENESVVKVFESLEEAYGIDLEYDKKLLENCKITTKLEDEPLFQKLNIICLALDLSYTENDAKIYIEGTNCQ